MTDHINHSSSIAQEVSCISGTYCQVQRLLLAIPHVHNKPKETYLQPLAGILQYSRRKIVKKNPFIEIGRILLHLEQFSSPAFV